MINPFQDRVKRLKFDYLVIAIVAAVFFMVQSLAWPLSQGRDYGGYIWYYKNFFELKPVFHTLMLYRTPIAPFFYGGLLENLGPGITELIAGVFYVLAIIIAYRIGLFWDKTTAKLYVAALLLYPAYSALYHVASSDGPFAFLFLFWFLLIISAATSPSTGRFILVALVYFILVLTRPASQIYLVFALIPLGLSQISLKRRMIYCAVCLEISFILLIFWATHNYYRYDDFTISRTGAAQAPLYRLFIKDRLVSAKNGPHSRELAALVKSQLLTAEPYLSYEIDLNTFFSAGNSRMYYDLIGLSDKVWGWDSDHINLRKVALEALMRHPSTYLQNVSIDFYRILERKFRYSAPSLSKNNNSENPPETMMVVGDKLLPVPSGDQRIPGGHLWWLASSPDNSVSIDWQNIDAPFYRFEDPEVQQLRESLLSREIPNIPNREGNIRAAQLLNYVTLYLYPAMLLWIVVGLIGFFYQFELQDRVLAFMFTISMGIILITVASTQDYLQFRVPFDPIFILMGTMGSVRIVRQLGGYFRNLKGYV